MNSTPPHCELSYPDVQNFIELNASLPSPSWLASHAQCDESFVYYYKLKSALFACAFTATLSMHVKNFVLRLIRYNFKVNVRSPPMLMNLFAMVFSLVQMLFFANDERLHYDDGGVAWIFSNLGTAFLLTVLMIAGYMQASVILLILEDERASRRSFNEITRTPSVAPLPKGRGKIVPQQTPSGIDSRASSATDAGTGLAFAVGPFDGSKTLRTLQRVRYSMMVMFGISSIVLPPLRLVFASLHNVLNGSMYAVAVASSIAAAYHPFTVFKLYRQLLALMTGPSSAQVRKHLQGSMSLVGAATGMLLMAAVIQLAKTAQLFSESFAPDEAGNYLSLTNSTFEFLKLAGGVLSYEFNSVDNSGRYWRTMERNLASSSKRNVASKLSTASIKRKSLMMEAVNVMDKQFEAIMEDDGDTSTYSSTSSAGFISTVVFFSLSFTLYPLAFTLAMILGSNSLVWIGSIIVALFVGSFLSACTLAEWGRDEGVQAIMNYYEGRTVKWFNYLPMLLDLATIALSTFDTALLAPYIGDEYGNLGAVVSLWAAVYSPGALLKHVDVSSYLIGACMNSLLIAITLLAACDITSKFVRFKGVWRRIVDVGNTLIYDLLVNGVTSLVYRGSTCTVLKADAPFRTQWNETAMTTDTSVMTFHPLIECDGKYYHIVFTMLHWGVLSLPLLGVGLTYLMFARNKQARPRVFEISGFLSMRVFCKIAITLYVNIASRSAFPSDIAYSATKNSFILLVVCTLMAIAIRMMPALGPQSGVVNLTRISVFACVVGLALANLLNLALLGSGIVSGATVLTAYCALPVLVTSTAVWMCKARAFTFQATALRLSQALASSVSAISVGEGDSASGLSDEERRTVQCMILTVRNDIREHTIATLCNTGDIEGQVATLQFLNSVMVGSPLVRRFLFSRLDALREVVTTCLSYLRLAASTRCGLEEKRCDLLSEASHALLQLSHHSLFYVQTLNKDRELLYKVVQILNLFSHCRFVDDSNVDDEQYLSVCQRLFNFLAAAQSVDSKNTIRDKAEVVVGAVVHPVSSSRAVVDRWIEQGERKHRGTCTLFLEGDVVRGAKGVTARTALWSSMVNCFAVLWESASAMTRGDLRSIVTSTILGSVCVQVLCIVVPSESVAEGGERLVKEMAAEAESVEMRTAINRVCFRIHNGTGDAHDAVQRVKFAAFETLKYLRSEIDNDTLLGQAVAAAKISRKK